MKSTKQIKLDIIEAGHQAVEHLIEVAKEKIIKPNTDDELAEIGRAHV